MARGRFFFTAGITLDSVIYRQELEERGREWLILNDKDVGERC